MPRAGPRKLHRYSDAFKLTAVRLSQQPGIQVQTVAAALEIHPFMLSKWRTDAKEGRLRGRAPKAPAVGLAREIARLEALERKYAILQEEHELLKKGHPVLGGARRSPSDRFAFIDFLVTEGAGFKVAPLCERYHVTRSGFYAWRTRQESRHAAQDRALTTEILRRFRMHEGRYGSPRLHRELVAEGWPCSRRRVARLMRAAGLRGKAVHGYRRKAGSLAHYAQYPNRVARARVTRANQVWVADITYLRLPEGWRYLAVVLDHHSRRVLAWTLSRRRTARETCGVLARALRRRRPPRGLIFHSDRGTEYMAEAFCAFVARAGLRQSASRRGPGDNARAESFFHSLKAELTRGVVFPNEPTLRRALTRYIRYYNTRRMYSALGYRSPIAFEADVA